MKIFKIAIICMSMVTIFATMSFAAAANNGTAGGAPCVIADPTNTAPPDLTFTPSPTTLMAWNTTANTYALTAVSAKTNAANGRQYGVLSSMSPIYESGANVATDGTVSLDAPSSSTSLGSATVGTWMDKAGNTAP